MRLVRHTSSGRVWVGERRTTFRNRRKSEGLRYDPAMSLAEVVGDLLQLQNLARDEEDPDRRRSLDGLRAHVARRERGAKVSEAAEILGISQPTVRAWIDSAILTAVPAAKPVRIDVLALAETKRALDLIRDHVDDRPLLIRVMRILRDRAALAGSEEGFADLREGRTAPLGEDLVAEIAELHARDTRRRSKSR